MLCLVIVLIKFCRILQTQQNLVEIVDCCGKQQIAIENGKLLWNTADCYRKQQNFVGWQNLVKTIDCYKDKWILRWWKQVGVWKVLLGSPIIYSNPSHFMAIYCFLWQFIIFYSNLLFFITIYYFCQILLSLQNFTKFYQDYN